MIFYYEASRSGGGETEGSLCDVGALSFFLSSNSQTAAYTLNRRGLTKKVAKKTIGDKIQTSNI